MVNFTEYSTVAANCYTKTQIEMRDGTVEHLQGRRTTGVRQQPDLGRRDLRLAVREGMAGRDRMSPRGEHRHTDRTGEEQ